MTHRNHNLFSKALPQRGRAHVLGDIAVRAVISCFPDEWIHREERPDYGVDLVSEVVLGSDVTGTQFGIQVKGKDASRVGNRVEIPHVKASTINYWRKRPYRVMLAVYLSEEDVVVWRWVDDLAPPTTEQTTLYISAYQELASTDWNSFVRSLESHYERAMSTRLSKLNALQPLTAMSLGELDDRPIKQGPVETDCAIDVYPDAVVIHYSGDKCGVVDCGLRSHSDVIDWLQHNEVRHLSFVALSHLHFDHYGGLASITAGLDGLDCIFLPPLTLFESVVRDLLRAAAERPPRHRSLSSLARFLSEIERWHEIGTQISEYHGVQRVRLGRGEAGQEISMKVFFPMRAFQKFRIHAMRPEEPPFRLVHDSICPIFRFSLNETAFLLPGDARSSVWHEVCETAGDEIRAGGLVLPHHGSRDGLTAGLLRSILPDGGFPAIVQPNLMLGLPDPKTLSEVRNQGGTVVLCKDRPARVRLRDEGVVLE